MKRGILLLVLLFVMPFANAVPTLNLFNGDVLCDSTAQTSYSIYANVSDGSDSFNVSGSVSYSGEYILFVGASNGYNISFYVDDVLIKTVPYNESLIEIDNDLVLDSSHALCYSDPGSGPGSDPGGNGDADECGDDDVNQNFEECDGDDLDDETCLTLDFDGGTLGCKEDCTFDVSSCTGGSSYCGDGNCDTNESCVNCEGDCGECPPDEDEWNLSGPTVDVPQEGVMEVVTVGGEYVLVLSNDSYNFSVYEVNSESIKIWIDDAEYILSSNTNLELNVGDSIVLVSYLDFQDDLVKLSFQNAGVRATMMNTGVLFIVFLIVGLILVSVGILFLIRKLSANKSGLKNPISKKEDSEDAGLLAGPKN